MPNAENVAGLWMPDPEASENGRPFTSHDRHLTDGHARELHAEHMASMCPECGCCWCCDDDCCAEYTCSNTNCGCSDKPASTYVIPPEKSKS